MSYVITVASQKGGSGKSTVTMQLAGALNNNGRNTRVLVVDADRPVTVQDNKFICIFLDDA